MRFDSDSLGLASLWSKFARLSGQYHVWRRYVGGGAGGDDDCSCGEFHLVSKVSKSVGWLNLQCRECRIEEWKTNRDGDCEKSRVDGLKMCVIQVIKRSTSDR